MSHNRSTQGASVQSAGVQGASIQSSRSPQRRARPAILRVLAVVALVLAPLAGGLLAVSAAPAVRVHDVGLDGLNLDIKLRPGHNTTDIDSALLGGLRTKAPTILGKPVGIQIRPNDLNLDLFDDKGALDASTIDVAGHLFADPQAQRAERNHITSRVIRYYGTVFCLTVYVLAGLEMLGYLYFKRRQVEPPEPGRSQPGSSSKLSPGRRSRSPHCCQSRSSCQRCMSCRP